MTDNAALATAIQALTAMLTTMQNPPARTVVLDPFKADEPFDLSTRQGSQVYNDSSALLDETWDGSVATFPSFIVSLQLRASEANWNAAAPHGILTVDDKDILNEYHSVTEEKVKDARTARTDSRAQQNARAMFKCIKSSIEGSVKETVFTQSDNLPTHACGVMLFKKLTTLASVSSLQLSFLSFSYILKFNPIDMKFDIPNINTKLSQLFTLATTSHRKLLDSERIQHTLNVYFKIMQPEVWAQWVRNKSDAFEAGAITKYQDFMNTAVIKYNQIADSKSGFKGSIHTVQ